MAACSFRAAQPLARRSSSGGAEFISVGGTDVGGTVSSGGNLNVASGGTASAATLSGGTEVVALPAVSSAIRRLIVVACWSCSKWSHRQREHHGQPRRYHRSRLRCYTISGIEVTSGQTLEIASGGIASNTTVDSGGTLEILSGGSAIGTTNNGGTVSGGGPTVTSGEIFTVSSGQTSDGIVVLNGGQLYVSSGGTANGAVISTGGFEQTFAGGETVSMVLVGGDGGGLGDSDWNGRQQWRQSRCRRWGHGE